MQKILIAILLAASLLVLNGCAHTIGISPDVSKLPTASPNISANKVGYYISDADRNRKLVTPGGGGDSVEHSPYRDLESGFYRVLSNVFASVDQLKSENESAFLISKNIKYILRPTISVTSSSSSVLTWPPTDFGIIIDVTASDVTGKVVWQDRVSGNGKAEFSEFKNDFALSAKRAAEAVLSALQLKLEASPLK